MANDAPPPPSNGKTTVQMGNIIAAVLIACVLIEGSVALGAIFYGVQDWNIVNGVADKMNGLALLLAGALAALAKPNSH